MHTSHLLLRWQLWLGTYSVGFFFFPCRLCCPLRFQSSPQTHQWEGFLLFGNFSSFTTSSPGQMSVPNSFVSLFVFYILSYLLLKRMGCLSGCLMFSASIQKLFCGSCSAFKWSFDEFVGEKVVSSPILSPPCFKHEFILRFSIYVLLIYLYVFVRIIVLIHSVMSTLWDPRDYSTPNFPVFHHLPELAQTESMISSSHLILCRPLLLLPSFFPSISVCSNESTFCIRGSNIGASASFLPVNIWVHFL